MNKAYVGVIIPAAGSGSRMGGVYKPLEKLCGKELLAYSLSAFQRCDEVSFVVISAREDKIEEVNALCDKYGFTKVKKVIAGGKDRQTSVENAFSCGLFDDENITHVAVHDAARPMLTAAMAKKAFRTAREKGSAVCASMVRDTVKRSDSDDRIKESVDRDNLWLIQTPQVFEKPIYADALKNAKNKGFTATDDSSLIIYNGKEVTLCDTPSYNIKITYPDDLYLAESILKNMEENRMRIGHGYDVHRLVPMRDLVLGGVKIDCELGLLGHSDADVLTHALMDAMLGALSLGDIGLHFPDSDDTFKDISSLVLLEQVVKSVHEKGYCLCNADVTVIAQAPKLRPYIDEMRTTLAKTIGCDTDRINIKATTEEKLGFTGRKEGIAAHAVVLLERK